LLVLATALGAINGIRLVPKCPPKHIHTMESHMNDRSPSNSDFEDSRFLQNLLISHWIPIIGGALVGLVIGIAIAMTQPKVWPATALAKIGQVGGTRSVTDPAAVLARTQFPSFVPEALRAAGMSFDVSDNSEAKLAKKTFTTQVQKGPDLFQMQVNGYTPADAKQFLTGALTVLQREHKVLLDAAIKDREQRLVSLKNSIEANQKEHQDILSSIKSNAALTGQQVSDTIAVAYLLRANEVERARFVEEQTILQNQLQEDKTYNTRLEAPIYVAEAPQGPSRAIAAFVGALLGFAVMVAFFALRAWFKPNRT